MIESRATRATVAAFATGFLFLSMGFAPVNAISNGTFDTTHKYAGLDRKSTRLNSSH